MMRWYADYMLMVMNDEPVELVTLLSLFHGTGDIIYFDFFVDVSLLSPPSSSGSFTAN